MTIEPTYHSFKGEGNELIAGLAKLSPSIDYKAIQIPIGLRYYMFVNDDARFFINAVLVLNFPTKNSVVRLTNLNASNPSSGNALDFDLKQRSFALGFGYRSKGRFSLETRYHVNRDLLKEYTFWEGNYNVVSFILGFRVY